MTPIIYVANYNKTHFLRNISITSLIVFQSQSPMSLLFEIDMDKLTEHDSIEGNVHAR